MFYPSVAGGMHVFSKPEEQNAAVFSFSILTSYVFLPLNVCVAKNVIDVEARRKDGTHTGE